MKEFFDTNDNYILLQERLDFKNQKLLVLLVEDAFKNCADDHLESLDKLERKLMLSKSEVKE